MQFLISRMEYVSWYIHVHDICDVMDKQWLYEINIHLSYDTSVVVYAASNLRLPYSVPFDTKIDEFCRCLYTYKYCWMAKCFSLDLTARCSPKTDAQSNARYALSTASVLSCTGLGTINSSVLLITSSPAPSMLGQPPEDPDTEVRLSLLLAIPSSTAHTELCEITKHSATSSVPSLRTVSAILHSSLAVKLSPVASRSDCEHEVEAVCSLFAVSSEDPRDELMFVHNLASSSANITASSMSIWSFPLPWSSLARLIVATR